MLLNQTNFNLTLIDKQINDWKSSMDFNSVILDNTPFPINGSSGNQNLNISSTYFISIEPSNTYFYWMGVCKFFLAYHLLHNNKSGYCDGNFSFYNIFIDHLSLSEN